MKKSLLILIGLVIGLGMWGATSLARSSDAKLDPAKVASQIHAIIQANRTLYATQVVSKLQAKGLITINEFWKTEDTLPLPAQFLIESGRMASEQSGGLKYRLISLQPVYAWNAPSTQFERKGLEAVTKDPSQPYSGYVNVGKERSFQAVFADVAVSNACVDCHNNHPKSLRKDYKLNDVMGGIVVSIPVD